MLGLLRQKLCKGLGPHSCLGMRSKGSSGSQFSRDESYLSSYPDGPQRKDCQRERDSVFPQCRRAVPWIPGCWWTQERVAALCPSPPWSVRLRCPRGLHLEESSWPRELCWASGGTAGSLDFVPARSVPPGPRDVHRSRRRRVPRGLAWPGPAHLPGLRPAPRSARGHLAGDRAPLVVTAAHRSGRVGPGWPLGGREAAAWGGAAWSCGEPWAGGGRAHSDSVGDPR